MSGSGAEEVQMLSLPDIHQDVLAALRVAGYDTVDKVLEANPVDLLALPGFDQETVDAIVAAAAVEKARQPVPADDGGEPATETDEEPATESETERTE